MMPAVNKGFGKMGGVTFNKQCDKKLYKQLFSEYV
jgi:hypothetical protein